MAIIIRPIGLKEHKAFVEISYTLNLSNPNWVPPLKMDAYELINPKKNPWFEHGEQQLFLAERGGKVVGRISAHIDHLALAAPAEQGAGPGTGNWGMLEAADEAVAQALIAHAEQWLREKGMTRVLAPLSISIWDEPGFLISGFDEPATIMMGYTNAHYYQWAEKLGYTHAQKLINFDIDISKPLSPLFQRIIKSGNNNPSITLRRASKKNFAQEAQIIIGILNDAWSDNWGFLPITESEIRYVSKKMKDIIYEDLVRVAEIDGEPVGFMMVWPDINEKLLKYKGKLFPFNVIDLLLWLAKPKAKRIRVPLMGVKKRYHASPLAAQLAFMMIEDIRKIAVEKYGVKRGDFGWVVESNKPMISVGTIPGGVPNKEYMIYQKTL
jgi:GNAT superfamily N-acetyltransferase